jgi:hypothetical protein
MFREKLLPKGTMRLSEKIAFDLSERDKGIYFLQLKTNFGITTQKNCNSMTQLVFFKKGGGISVLSLPIKFFFSSSVGQPVSGGSRLLIATLYWLEQNCFGSLCILI